MNRVKHKGNKVTVYSDMSYVKGDKKLLRVTDNGNGFTVKSYSWNSVSPDLYWNIPYDVAADLMDALGHFDFRDDEPYDNPWMDRGA